MDDPTRRCENDTDNGTRLLGAPGPKREPHFFAADRHPVTRPGPGSRVTEAPQSRFVARCSA
jgi:hypothetical protein